MLELILYFGPVILVVLLVLLIITQGYVKAPPDHAYIISGLRKEPRVLVGRAGLKLPFFEQLDKLYLGQITVDIKTDEYIPTNDFINVMVDAVAKVRVADDPAMLKLAMRNFLNKNSAKIAADLFLPSSLLCRNPLSPEAHPAQRCLLRPSKPACIRAIPIRGAMTLAACKPRLRSCSRLCASRPKASNRQSILPILWRSRP